jgi:regulatory protein
MRKEILNALYRYCAFQDRSRQQVRERLSTWRLGREEEAEIIQHLEEEQFLNEERYVRSIVRGKFYHKHWGRRKIRHLLYNQQIDPPLADRVIETEIPEEAYAETLERLARAKYAETRGDEAPQRFARTARFLVQKGYEPELVSQIVQQEAKKSLEGLSEE